jgi:hypothetical protein
MNGGGNELCVVERKQQTAPGDQRQAYKNRCMEATLMKVLGVISTTALLLLFGATVPAFAQEEHHEQEAKPEKQQQAKPEKQQQAKPEKQQQQAKPAKQEQQAKGQQEQQQAKGQQEQKQQQAKSAKQEQQKQAKGQQEQKQQQTKSVNQEHEQQAKAQPERQRGQHPQRSAADEQRHRAEPALRLSARGSGRIPDDRFRANFGQEHVFVINEPVMVGGFSRFQYGGFWFGFVNPWPAEWYYTDNVYVDFIDGGYYLCNPYYPGARVAISVVI